MRHPTPEPGDGAGFVGVDRGLAAYVVAATATGGEVARIPPPKPLVRALPRLRRASRALSRKRPGSANRARAARRLARMHGRVADRRAWFTHQVSTGLVKTHDRLCIEDLATANLTRNRRRARSIADAAWGQLGRQLAYKAGWYGTTLAVAPRFFASSKTCSGCGRVNPRLGLGDRVFGCHTANGGCGLVIDRDRNAAVNQGVGLRGSFTRPPDGGRERTPEKGAVE
jgi:putative transposase